MAGRGKPGRPYKGQRKRVEVRLPVSLAEAVEHRAHLDGQNVNTWVERLLAEHLNFPATRQESLPLTNA
jgi:predicted HicB family RNase H-like nuclease